MGRGGGGQKPTGDKFKRLWARGQHGVALSPPRPPKVPSAPRCNLLQLEVVGALLELLVLGLDGFAQFLQNLRWGEGDALAQSVAELCRPGGPLLRT